MCTLAFPYRHDESGTASHPCSDSNHLILKSWKGSDKYDVIRERIGEVHAEVQAAVEDTIFIGGDLSFICTICGASCAMSQPCPWCAHFFDKSRNGEKNLIPWAPVIPSKKRANAISRQDKIWDFDPINVILIALCQNHFVL